MVGEILPEALEDGANMVPYSKLVVKLTGGTGVLNIWPEETEIGKIAFKKPFVSLSHTYITSLYSLWFYSTNYYYYYDYYLMCYWFLNYTNTFVLTITKNIKK